MQSYKCMHDSYGCLFLSSRTYVAIYAYGKIVYVISEKTSERNRVCMIAMAASSFTPPEPVSGKIIHVISPHYNKIQNVK